MKKNKKILMSVGVVLVIIAIGGFYLWWSYTHSDIYLVEKYVQEQQERYENDTVGGQTPEETLELFISALKEENLELASKYFVLDEQEEWYRDLSRIKKEGFLDEMISDLEDLETSKKNDGEAFYVLTDETNLVVVQLIITKNTSNGVWKITEL